MRGSIPSESPWMEAPLSRSSFFLVTRGSPFCFLWCKNPTLTLLLRPLFSCLPSFVMRSLLHATWVQVLLLVIASIDWLSKGLLWLQNRQAVPSKDQQRRRGHIRRSACFHPTEMEIHSLFTPDDRRRKKGCHHRENLRLSDSTISFRCNSGLVTRVKIYVHKDIFQKN